MDTKKELEQKTKIFMYAYMFVLEKLLISRKEDLESINYHKDEANLDNELKEYVKELIEKDCPSLDCSEEKILRINSLTNEDQKHELTYAFFKGLKINKVYLKDTITQEIKTIISKEGRVYTNPDLLLEIKDDTYTTYVSIELKSTKNNSIPGSSIQQITPDEWVIFIKHNSEIEVVTGQYINALNNKLQFPDRSPRPSIAFNELEQWNRTYRTEDISGLTFEIDEEDVSKRKKLINDFQIYLAEEWLEVLKKETTPRRNPWFHNTLRKFSLIFLEYYDSLTDTEKKEFKQNAESLIEQ